MSDYPCGKCGGSGCSSKSDDYHCSSCQPDDTRCNFAKICPSCNKGRVRLAVPCENCSGTGEGRFTPEGMAECGEGISCKQCTNTSGCAICPDCTNGYRPLTDDEVRELTGETTVTGDNISQEASDALITAMLFCAIDDGLEFKGQKVVLIPTTN